MGEVVIQDGRAKVVRAALCTDCEKEYTPASCHHGDAEFVRGYDQAAAEVMSEVKARDSDLYHAIVTKFPTWQIR